MDDHVTGFEQSSTDDLRERAVELARRRWDVRFFWRLLALIPAAEAVAGNMDASEASVAQTSGLLYEALSEESDPEVQEALRPVYIEYLTEHGTAPRTGAGTVDDPAPDEEDRGPAQN